MSKTDENYFYDSDEDRLFEDYRDLYLGCGWMIILVTIALIGLAVFAILVLKGR